MGLLTWVVLGGIAGWIAKKIMPGEKHGTIVTIALGIAGGVLGGAISSAIFGIPMGSFFDLRSWLICVIGALGMLVAYRFIMDKMGYNSDAASDVDTAAPEHRAEDHSR